MRRRLFCLLLIATSATSAACGDKATTTPTPVPASPTTLSTRLTVGGAISRTFTTTKAGQISVTLSNTGSPTTVLGLGLGVPLSGVANCALTVSVDTAGSSTPQIVSDSTTGSYCVAVYDNGTLKAPADFDLTITFP